MVGMAIVPVRDRDRARPMPPDDVDRRPDHRRCRRRCRRQASRGSRARARRARARGGGRFRLPLFGRAVARQLASGQIAQPDAVARRRVTRDGAAKADFDVVGMRAEHQQIDRHGTSTLMKIADWRLKIDGLWFLRIDDWRAAATLGTATGPQSPIDNRESVNLCVSVFYNQCYVSATHRSNQPYDYSCEPDPFPPLRRSGGFRDRRTRVVRVVRGVARRRKPRPRRFSQRRRIARPGPEPGPDSKVQPGAPAGEVIKGEFAESKVYPGHLARVLGLHPEAARSVEAGAGDGLPGRPPVQRARRLRRAHSRRRRCRRWSACS